LYLRATTADDRVLRPPRARLLPQRQRSPGALVQRRRRCRIRQKRCLRPRRRPRLLHPCQGPRGPDNE